MAFVLSDHLKSILDNLPHQPGVYMMKNAAGKIIYIGKAKSLRSRVRSYFTANADGRAKTIRMRNQVADIEYILCENEVKALIVEESMIKRHKPRYNISLRDDKRYPYIRITWHEDFPRVETTRRVENDGARYFGPYAAMWAVQNTLRTLRRVFPYLTCDREITGRDERACLFHDIKLCSAPCIGAVNKEQYRAMIKELMDVLSGKSEDVLARLEREMLAEAEALNFERAALLRDQIKAIEFITTRHKAVSPKMTDQDVIALAREDGTAVVQILFIRNGKLIGSDSRQLENADEEPDETVLEQFLTQFYADASEVPNEILLPNDIEQARIIERWLRDKRGGKKIEITVPQRGDKRELIALAQRNALEAMRMIRAQYETDTTKHEEALAELQRELGLPRIPNRIECFDISTTQGTSIVASRVVFTQGVPAKSEYRRFNIRTVIHDGPDDFQSMREALTRRFARWKDAVDNPLGTAPDGKDKDETWKKLPDLLLIDGGKGQLSVAVEVLAAFGLTERVPVASLAKQFEEVFLPDRPTSIVLNRRSPALYLIQRVRDEAHRYAVHSHRQQRSKASMASKLEAIPGIGPKKKKALLKHFGNSIHAIRQATVEELCRVPGINRVLAETIHMSLE